LACRRVAAWFIACIIGGPVAGRASGLGSTVQRVTGTTQEFELRAGDDLVARVAHEKNPVRAIVELIWNGIDAEAENISVEFERLESDGIDIVRVIDDGHGISVDEVEATFTTIGDSWKSRALKSKNGRRTRGIVKTCGSACHATC